MSAGTGKLTWTEDLAADLEQQSRRLETALPEEIIRWAVERFFSTLDDGNSIWSRRLCHSSNARKD